MVRQLSKEVIVASQAGDQLLECTPDKQNSVARTVGNGFSARKKQHSFLARKKDNISCTGCVAEYKNNYNEEGYVV